MYQGCYLKHKADKNGKQGFFVILRGEFNAYLLVINDTNITMISKIIYDRCSGRYIILTAASLRFLW